MATASCPSSLWPSAASPLASSWASFLASSPVPLVRFEFLLFIGAASFCFREFYENTVFLMALFTLKNLKYSMIQKFFLTLARLVYKKISFVSFENTVSIMALFTPNLNYKTKTFLNLARYEYVYKRLLLLLLKPSFLHF
jgi:hypothetical protein